MSSVYRKPGIVERTRSRATGVWGVVLVMFGIFGSGVFVGVAMTRGAPDAPPAACVEEVLGSNIFADDCQPGAKLDMLNGRLICRCPPPPEP